MAYKKASKRRKIIVGNWKMNPGTLEEARNIFVAVRNYTKKVRQVTTVICPPFPFLGIFKATPALSLGVQNIYTEERGSFTGEVSALMVKALGATYSIIGHSERRKGGETDEMVALKVALSLKENLNTILCVGEEVRDAQGDYLGFLKQQIKNSLAKVTKKQLSRLIIAYEPIWAIGATAPMTPSDLHEMNIFIKKTVADMYGQEEALAVPILYGGSVNFRNAKEIVVGGEVDGLLVGRESINPIGFIEILKEVDTI